MKKRKKKIYKNRGRKYNTKSRIYTFKGTLNSFDLHCKKNYHLTDK